jgi:hypothetical protein
MYSCAGHDRRRKTSRKRRGIEDGTRAKEDEKN